MISLNFFLEKLDSLFSAVVSFLEKLLFFSVGDIPVIILWLLIGGVFLTLRLGFVSIWGFKHALDIAIGKDQEANNSSMQGEVSSFQALATALSGSVGLGNIAGVAIAIQVGGPGAIFWMTVGALLGMSSKLVESTLGLLYRDVKPDGTVKGGPMYYLTEGLASFGLGKLGRVLALLFSLGGVGASLGGGNMFQSNQAFAALTTVLPGVRQYDWVFGLCFAFLVGLVIVGGIGRIGIVTSRLVPFMVTLYIVLCLWVLGNYLTEIPKAVLAIITQAFHPESIQGGVAGVLVQGLRRSVFSNNAGLGVAAIAHSVARTDKPVREGIVAILEPFIDTVIICNLTALVILVTGSYSDSSHVVSTGGSPLATAAFATVVSWFPFVLTLVIMLFAFSTLIAWSYYGECCWAYLLGERSIFLFKGLFLFCIFLGSVVNLGAVVDFSDMMLLGTSVPNILGCLLLSGKVANLLDEYWKEFKENV